MDGGGGLVRKTTCHTRCHWGSGESEYVKLLYILVPPTHTARGGRAIGRGGPETHVHKIANVPVFDMALGFTDFDAGNSITWATGRGRP